VNTGALVASALNINDDVFTRLGLAGAINDPTGVRPAFEGTPTAGAAIRVEQGATLESGERVFLIAPIVENAGTIHTPDGQTILAGAQDRVYLASDRQLRGLLVEVGTGGSVTNLGDIITERGNTTLVGLAVNQSGRIRATTSVNVNGSIRLVAQDGASATNSLPGAKPNDFKPTAAHTGTLRFGENSLTEIALDTSASDTAVDGQTQSLSDVGATGRTIELQSGARIVVPGGNVTLSATDIPGSSGGSRANTINLAAGAVIDVSGDDSTVVAMERNQASIRLFGNELADAPAQRGGPLARAEITVDIRKGTPLTDISRLREGIERGVGERMSVGGQVILDAGAGDVVLNPGSRIDVSGGQVRYRDGYLNTTLLVTADGRIVDIANADPNVQYAGIVGRSPRSSNRWGATPELQSLSLAQYQPGYVEGKDAGGLTINSGRAALNGDLSGGSVRGSLQRAPSTATTSGVTRTYTEVALSGLLSLTGSAQLRFTNTQANLSYDFGTPLPDLFPTLVSTQWLRDAGINRVSAVATTQLSLPEDVRLSLSAGGELDLSARNVALAGDIDIVSGRLRVNAVEQDNQLGNITVAESADIDLRGGWVNDLRVVNNDAVGTDALFINGGSAAFTAQGNLTMAAGSVVDVSSGAQLRSNGSPRYGSAGTVSLASKVPAGENTITTLALDGTLRGFGFSQGGTLRLTAPSFRIGEMATPAQGEVALTPDFFRTGGFANYSLSADRGGIEVDDNTQVLLSPHSLQLSGEYQARATGSNPYTFTELATLPELLRGTSSLSASVIRNDRIAGSQAIIRIGEGARIETEARGSISLTADTDVLIDGTLIARGGQVAVALANPSVANETGYRANQALYLGPRASIDVSGVTQIETNDLGIRSGRVLAGGTINLQTARGYIFATPGSVMNVSGAQGAIELPDANGIPVTNVVASDAGEIRVRAAEGIVLSGQLNGAAGGEHAEGGALGVTIDATLRDPDFRVGSNPTRYAQFPTAQREVIVSDSLNLVVGEGVSVPEFLNGRAFVSTASIAAGGFDSVSLASLPLSTASGSVLNSFSPGAIRFDGDIDLRAGRRIALNAQVIASNGGSARVSAPLVTVGPSVTGFRAVATPTVGTGSLSVTADHIDFVGNTVFSGFGVDTAQPALRFVSAGDIRFNGVRFDDTQTGNLPGSIRSLSSIEFVADQLYPSTLTDFSINVAGANGRISISGEDVSATPLSAAGALRLSAADIVQGGVVRAPFGQIELNATRSLELAPGSITSTSGAGLVVPFGLLELGTDWVYPLTGQQLVLSDAPQQSITLRAPTVTLAAGSQVDIRGGGDLLSYEFIKGPGGSQDILLANNAAGAFAILPGVSVFGAIDPNESRAAGIEVGGTITLSGGNGLPAGEYARLPARYALLPGAFLVMPVTNTSNVQPDVPQLLADGTTTVVAGRSSFAGTDIHDAQWSGYAVLNGDQVRQRAQYNVQLATNYFQYGARNPNDSGHLTFDAAQAIRLDGELVATAVRNGQAAQVDIVANNLAVVNGRTNSTQRVELVASELQNFGAASLLLGATRLSTETDNGVATTALSVRAQNVTIESGTTLSADEILLAAQNTVTVANGARLSATSTAAAASDVEQRLNIVGDGGLVRVSTADQVEVNRMQSTGQRGLVNIQSGATLAGSGSINLESSRDVLLQGSLQTPGSLSLTAGQISLGEAPSNASGLVLSNQTLAGLQAEELLLTSRTAVDLYGAVAVSAQTMRIDSSGLRGFGDNGTQAQIDATALTLTNTRNTSVATIGAGTGILGLSAGTLTIASGNFDINGFTSTQLLATREVVGDGQSVLRARGDLTVTAPRITATSGAELTLQADRSLTTLALTAPSDLAPVSALGARVNLTGQSIQHGSRIELPSGVVVMNASGSGGVTLATQSSIDVSGRDVDFGEITLGSPGGVVMLTASQGDIVIADQVLINVSGATVGGDAGRIALLANSGAAEVSSAATLRGTASAGETQGSFAMDAHTLSTDFSDLNTLLNAGDFTEYRAIAVQSGDLNIAAGDVVNARAVEFTTDTGSLNVAGRINATASEGGRVRLSAGGNVVVQQSASIDARATTGTEGGFVELATRGGTIDMQGVINVSGASNANTGHVSLRAPRIGTSVALVPIAGSVTGAERIDLEAFRTYNATQIDSTLIGSIVGDTAAYMANAAAIESSLGVAGDARFHLLPGVEINSSGNLALATSWDLFGQRYGGEAGVLTLRAAGNLSINQNLSDGVLYASQAESPVYGPLPERDVVQTGPSWSYRFVAGARAGAADPLGVTRGVGNITVADNTYVRTGTGSISLSAGNDVVLSTSSSAIYTVGENRGIGVLDPVDAEILLRGDFVHNGGDLRIAAGGSIRGVADRPLADWLPRISGEYVLYNALNDRPNGLAFPTAWAIDVSKFYQGFGALGGGNIDVTAGGNLQSVVFAIPTTGLPNAADGSDTALAGGGSIRAEVDGDILGGSFLVMQGHADLLAHGRIGAATANGLAPILQLGDAQFALHARVGATIETAFSPSVAMQDPLQGLPNYHFGLGPTNFFEYTDSSAVNLETIAGDVLLAARSERIRDLYEDGRFGLFGSDYYLQVYPASFAVRSLQGDVLVQSTIRTIPSLQSGFELFAYRNVSAVGGARILQSDADLRIVPRIGNPSDQENPTVLFGSLESEHSIAPISRFDYSPVRVIAAQGAISNLSLSLNQQARFYAATDIANLNLRAQHVHLGDVSVIEAGRDIFYATPRSISGALGGNSVGIAVAGPGNVDLIAGRNVSFGSAQGVETIGNSVNGVLPDGGANINIWTGQAIKPDYESFIARYLDESTEYAELLRAFLDQHGRNPALSDVANLRALDEAERRRFVAQVLYSEIKAGGLGDNAIAFNAIATLFPDTDPNAYRGDLSSFLSYIRTVDGGDIDVIVPNGLVNAGVASSGGLTKSPAELGIVAQRLGDINAMVRGDFLVNASRVFSLDGGDIMIWSSAGDIDAGRGSKAAISIPPPISTIDPLTGSVTVEFPPAVQGSGIRTAVSTAGRDPGNVYLFAPKGVVDAGDAGIVSAGNITIVATRVIGADNIQVGGTSVGVPVSSGGLGASLAGVSSSASSATNAATIADGGNAQKEAQHATLADSALSWLEVFVVGLGDEGCKQDDIECLKRQK
jgi:hypothetical protein